MSTIEKRLASLALLGEKSHRAEGKIRTAAEGRLQAVNDRLDVLRPTVALHGGEEYLALIKERGQLLRVIAQADKHRAS